MAKDETKVGDGSVTLTKEQFEGLMGRLAKLESGKGPGVPRPKRVKEREALVRFHNGVPVVGYSNHREVLNPETGTKVAYFDLQLLDTDKKVTVPYLSFLNEPNSVKVRVVSQEATENIRSEGKIRTTNPDPANISGSFKDFRPTEADLEVTSYQYVALVEVLDGEHQGMQFKINTNALNA